MVNMIEEVLKRVNIKIKDIEKVKRKLEELKKCSYNHLQVLADFDYTISHLRHDNERKSSSFGALEKYNGMSEEFRANTKALFDHYYPLEVDGTIEKEKKIELMTQWFTRSSNYIINERVTPSIVQHAADTSKVKLRDRFDEFVSLLREKNIPLLVFSAGVYQVIERVLENAGIPSDNIKIIANELQFGNEGHAECFKPPLITTGNKSTVAASHTGYYKIHKDQYNAILLGDNVEDVQMSSVLKEYSKTILTVGFLNDNVIERIELYQNTFDIVIVNDPDFSDVIALLDCLQN